MARISPSSSLLSITRSANRRRMTQRSLTGSAAQASCAATAPSTAFVMSSAVAEGTVSITCSVAGLTTFWVLPSEESPV